MISDGIVYVSALIGMNCRANHAIGLFAVARSGPSRKSRKLHKEKKTKEKSFKVFYAVESIKKLERNYRLTNDLVILGSQVFLNKIA